MLAIELPDDLEQRLDALVASTGRSKGAFMHFCPNEWPYSTIPAASGRR